MSADSLLNEDTQSASLQADVTDNSSIFQFTEIVSLTRDTDAPCTTECGTVDWSAQANEENLQFLKQEPQDVC